MATTGASLGPIYERLNAIEQQHPMNAETFADWSMEAGDTVTINRDTNSYESRVDSAVIKWCGKTPTVQINSEGNEKRDAVAKVSRQKYSRGGSGMRIQQGLYSDVWSEDGHVHSVISQTSSTLTAYVQDTYRQMQSGLALTSSSAALYVQDSYTQMQSGLSLTSSSAALYVENKYTQMQSGLALTSSSAALYVENKYTQMQSGLSLTSSSAALYVENKYTQMQSGLALTSSSAALYVENKYTQMQSGLALTSSSAALYVENKYTQMQSGLALTSSSAALYVDNKYLQMQSGLALTSNSAKLYVDGKTSKAQILLTINGQGKSQTLIEADVVKVDGETTINNVFGITDNNVYVKKSMFFGAPDNQLVSISASSGTITAQKYIVGLNDNIELRGPSASTISLNYNNVKDAIKSIEKNGNVLTITPYVGESWTFSKATSLSDEWSGNTLTVTAKQEGEPVADIVISPYVQVETGGETYNNFDVGVATAKGSAPGYDIRGDKTYFYLLQSGTRVIANTKNDGSGTSLAGVNITDPYLLEGNIRNGITILGVTGNYSGTSYASRTLRCTSVEQTYPGSSTYYYTFRLEGNYSFNSGTNYTFYRPSWS